MGRFSKIGSWWHSFVRRVLPVLGEVLAGGGVAVFFGLLLGLSATSVVVTSLGIIGTVVTVGVLGHAPRNGKSNSEGDKRSMHGGRLAGFGFFGAAALLVGIWLRSHDTLGLSPAARLDRLAKLPDVMQYWALFYNETGLYPEGVTASTPGPLARGLMLDYERAKSPGDRPAWVPKNAGNVEIADMCFEAAVDVWENEGQPWRSFAEMFEKAVNDKALTEDAALVSMRAIWKAFDEAGRNVNLDQE